MINVHKGQKNIYSNINQNKHRLFSLKKILTIKIIKIKSKTTKSGK